MANNNLQCVYSGRWQVHELVRMFNHSQTGHILRAPTYSSIMLSSIIVLQCSDHTIQNPLQSACNNSTFLVIPPQVLYSRGILYVKMYD